MEYDALLSTIAMPKLLEKIVDNPPVAALANIPDAFKFQTVHLVGIGVWGQWAPGYANETHWIYFPEAEYPFYRLTVLSKFSPFMVAQPGKQYSIIAEVSESKYRKVNKDTVVEEVLQGMIRAKFIAPDAKIATRWHERFEYGYPVPYVGRDEHVHRVDAELRALDIWSRGRFGAWKYEVANQDHCMMQGVEAADAILFGTEELTFKHPDLVNGGKGRQTPIRPPAPAPFDKTAQPAQKLYAVEHSEMENIRTQLLRNDANKRTSLLPELPFDVSTMFLIAVVSVLALLLVWGCAGVKRGAKPGTGRSPRTGEVVQLVSVGRVSAADDDEENALLDAEIARVESGARPSAV
jgi:hypothetical protein